MKLEGIYQSAVKLALLVITALLLSLAVCVALDVAVPSVLGAVLAGVLYLLLTPSVLLHYPLAHGEFLPLPGSWLGWVLGVLFLFLCYLPLAWPWCWLGVY
ncbi:hypothetical protein HPC37_03050 [Pasteurellaceae bacterium 20609_3]|uniref:hypothetical protein n=1 Tax=Spirabiliibacterium mucosae TaxID=28156 RepID=UPI001AAD327B|nr:hypothetical protein [Spirabiliibacterium mucosae]MBE2897832.1 hypothetical protein [Spirabiliibacterium mucosae]